MAILSYLVCQSDRTIASVYLQTLIYQEHKIVHYDTIADENDHDDDA